MGILHNELMRVYDMRPSTAEYVMDITEWIDRIAKLEYAQGRIDEALDEKWIPLSETSDLPEYEVMACNKYGELMFGFLSGADGKYECDSDNELMCDVVAWMKKPKPYKENKHE